MLDLVLAIGHHLLIFGIFGVLFAEFWVLQPGMSNATAVRPPLMDGMEASPVRSSLSDFVVRYLPPRDGFITLITRSSGRRSAASLRLGYCLCGPPWSLFAGEKPEALRTMRQFGWYAAISIRSWRCSLCCRFWRRRWRGVLENGSSII
jgi:hypothetical protein